ncbi:MAG: hypothetical protein WD294_08435 [Phycisphaeraceae bacterium]
MLRFAVTTLSAAAMAIALAPAAASASTPINSFPDYAYPDGAGHSEFTEDANGLSAKGYGTGTPVDFMFGAGPAGSPKGDGSLTVKVTDADSKIIIGPGQVGNNDVSIGDLTTLSYATHSANANHASFYLNMYLDTNSDSVWDTELRTAPIHTSANQWITWDALDRDWSVGQAKSGSTYTAGDVGKIGVDFTDGILLNDWDNNDYPPIAFSMGDTSGGYVGHEVSIDGFNIAWGGDNAGDLNYTFVTPTPVAGVLGLAAFGMLGMRRGRRDHSLAAVEA